MKYSLCLCVLALSLAFGAARQEAAGGPAAKTIAEVAASDGRFSTLLAAVKAADLVPALAGPGPLTVFAPTDAAFKALPEGVVAGLLKPEARGDLMRVLTYHVVQGKVLSSDLLKASSAATLAGPSVSFGLRVGNANVIQADVVCSNGVIHVIDAVLLPPAEAPRTAMAAHGGSAGDAIRAAIDVGAPAYNRGDIEGCASIYTDTARRMLATDGTLGEMHALELADVLATRHDSADAQAWALRRTFDRVLADEGFRARMEAELPAGFPGPGPVGRVVMKQYPGYRAARAQGGQSSFWTLFQHIQSNDVKMTTPVEMTMDEQMRSMDMAFLYERPEQGAAGTQGRVAVLDLPPLQVLSIGIRGDTSRANLEMARKALEQRLAKEGLVAAGPYRQLGYNSPMVPSSQRFWELQVPVQASR